MAIANCSAEHPFGGALDSFYGTCANATIPLWKTGTHVEGFVPGAIVAQVLSFSSTVVEVPGTGVGLYTGDWPAILEVLVVMHMGLLVLAVLAVIAFGVRTSKKLTSAIQTALVCALAFGLTFAPFGVFAFYGPLRSRLTNFAMSLVIVLGFFRLIELAFRTGPKGFDISAGRFVVYMASPVEVLFDDKGGIQKAQRALVWECFRSLLGHVAVFLCALSAGKATAFTPFLSQGTDPTSMPLLGFPFVLPAVYLQTICLYTQLTIAMQTYRFLLALMGIEAHTPMRQPMLFSSSVRDFWGRRWNLLIHRLMHRSFFVPLASKIGPRAGAISAFIVSGLFHEYMWLVTNYWEEGYKVGMPLAFFAAQIVICTIEVISRRSALGAAARSLPAVVQTALTTLAILPFGPLFLQGLLVGGFFADCARVWPSAAIAAGWA